MQVRYTQFSMDQICGCFGKSRQAFYQLRHRYQSRESAVRKIYAKVLEIRRRMPKLGGKKLHHLLTDWMKKTSIYLGRDRFFNFLRLMGLLAKKRKAWIRTTDSEHSHAVFENRIKGNLIKGPEQVWVNDLTYLPWQGRFVFLFLVMDAFSRRIMGFCLNTKATSKAAEVALRMARKKRFYDNKTLIHHSDRGIQYCSQNYINYLKSNNIEISMSAKGNPYDNAIMERTIGVLKQEFLAATSEMRLPDLYQKIKQSIFIYNHERPHWSLQLKTPMAVHLNF